jgi:hypothetical protein
LILATISLHLWEATHRTPGRLAGQGTLRPFLSVGTALLSRLVVVVAVVDT